MRFTAPNVEAVTEILRRLPGARETAASSFDLGGDPSGWPEATVSAEPGGAYFCDNCGGGGPAALGAVVAKLTSAFGAVVVEEL